MNITYQIIDTDTDSVESTHASLADARDHWVEQSVVQEVLDGQTITRGTTYPLHHRITEA